MRVPIEWLKEYVDVQASPEELAHRLTMAGLEVEAIEHDEGEPVLNVKVTPNRGDCLSMVGVAREVAALYGLPLRHPMPSARSDEPGDAAQYAHIQIIDEDLCPRYAARVVRNVRIAPSPEWMQKRLTLAGMRPINNVVDVTNYVMLELGQPLHAFDLDLLPGGQIVVRRAKSGERIVTLDGIERELQPEMLMICDATHPVAVAGVMGGGETEVTPNTRRVLLESAHFNPTSIRRTSQRLQLSTEASYRFERVVDPGGVVSALDRACELLQQIGAGEPVSGVVDVYPRPAQERTVTLRPERCNLLLGLNLDAQTMVDCLRRLQLKAELRDGVIHVTVPTFRPDLNIEEDLAEEVGRVYGYENIPERLPFGHTHRGGDSPDTRLIRPLQEAFVRAGLIEVHTHTLRAPGPLDDPARTPVRVRNAASEELSTLRNSLIPSLMDVVVHNLARRQTEIFLFEVGRVFRVLPDGDYEETLKAGFAITGSVFPPGWDARYPAADFFTAKGIVQTLLETVGVDEALYVPASDPRFHPGRSARVLVGEREVGIFGELHPDILEKLDIARRTVLAGEFDVYTLWSLATRRVRYVPLPRYPAVLRDLAVVAPEDLPYQQVEQTVRQAGGDLLESVRLFDVYRGERIPEGTRSLALSLTFRSRERTLTDDEVDQIVGRIVQALEGIGAKLRA
ncbi:MAG: phenylalanine--tRNA ligase subunit beta [Chthonomonadetes bacterium]|nr:phenylalanine--tRNA ligase subunit beta [Chthonomonadetes bacterium]